MNKWVTLGIVLTFLIAPCILTIQPVKASSKSIAVPDDYATIQYAIDAAHDGDTVFVRKGVYHENLKINNSISLTGEESSATIIDGNLSEGFRIPVKILHDKVAISGFTLSDSWAGIQVNQASECDISGNRMTNVQYGIILSSASGNSITANVIDSVKTNGYGIEASHASNNNIKGNQITSASIGIAIRDQLLSPTSVVFSKNNNISENIIANIKEYAIMLQFTSDNVLIGNNISNSGIGVSLLETDNNLIYHNNFIGNTKQVSGNKEPDWSGGSEIRYSTCQWDDGKEGNYWSDYNGTDTNHDGIGDRPYIINEKNADNAPLMSPVSISEFTFPSLNENYPSSTPTVTASPSPSPTPTATPPNPESFLTGQVIAASSALTVAIVGLLVYFKKYKH